MIACGTTKTSETLIDIETKGQGSAGCAKHYPSYEPIPWTSSPQTSFDNAFNRSSSISPSSPAVWPRGETQSTHPRRGPRHVARAPLPCARRARTSGHSQRSHASLARTPRGTPHPAWQPPPPRPGAGECAQRCTKRLRCCRYDGLAGALQVLINSLVMAQFVVRERCKRKLKKGKYALVSHPSTVLPAFHRGRRTTTREGASMYATRQKIQCLRCRGGFYGCLIPVSVG